MNQLNRITDLVRKGDSISITFKGTDTGTQVLVTPSLRGVDAEDTNETRRALLAALAAPFVVEVPTGESVVDALTAALDTISGPRSAAVEAHDAYCIALNDATARAKSATKERVKEPAKTPKAGKATDDGKPAATSIEPVNPESGQANDAGETAAVLDSVSAAQEAALSTQGGQVMLFDAE